MHERYEQALIDWAHRYNGYERLAGDPNLLGEVWRPLQEEYRRTGEIPDWAGVDLLRGWAFWLVRAHRHSGAYRPLTEEYPEFDAIVAALHRHPAATGSDLPLGLGATAPWPHDDLLHAWWAVPNRLLAGEYPGALTAEKARRKVGLLLDAGVGTIIDLTTRRDHLTPYRHLLDKAGRDVRYYAHPIPDNSVIDDAGYDAILARIHEEMDAGRMVYVHCWGGRGRTSTVIGCLLAETGLNYEATVTRIAELRSGTRKAKFPCPETESQHDILRARCSR